MRYQSITVFALLLSSASVATAQRNAGQPTGRDDSTTQQTTGQAASQTVDALILANIHRSNQRELEFARVAKENAQSPEVRIFADELIKDHSASDSAVTALAGELKVTLPKADSGMAALSAADGEGGIEQLRAIKGSDFDRAYTAAMVREHGQAVQMLEAGSGQVESGALKALIESTLPTVRAHLQAAERLAANFMGASPAAPSGVRAPVDSSTEARAAEEAVKAVTDTAAKALTDTTAKPIPGAGVTPDEKVPDDQPPSSNAEKPPI